MRHSRPRAFPSSVLPSGRARWSASDEDDEPLVHALSARRRERCREGSASLDRSRERRARQPDALRRLSESRRGACDVLSDRRRTRARRPDDDRQGRLKDTETLVDNFSFSGASLAEAEWTEHRLMYRHSHVEPTASSFGHAQHHHQAGQQQTGGQSVGLAGFAALEQSPQEREDHRQHHHARLGRSAKLSFAHRKRAACARASSTK